jgi:hypothetical protein
MGMGGHICLRREILTGGHIHMGVAYTHGGGLYTWSDKYLWRAYTRTNMQGCDTYAREVHIHTGTDTHGDVRTHGDTCIGKYTWGCIESTTMGRQRHMEGLYMDIYTRGDKYLHKEIYAWGDKYIWEEIYASGENYLQSYTQGQICMEGYRHGVYMHGGDTCKGDT